MTYFELINKTYDFLINENIEEKRKLLNFSEELPIEMLKEELKKAKIFLNLYYQNKHKTIQEENKKLLLFLDLYFTEYITDIEASFEKTILEGIKGNLELINDDEECQEMLDMLKELDLPEDEKNYYLNHIVNKFLYHIENDELEPQIIKKVFYTSLNNILDYIKESIIELMFSKEGRKYLNNPFWINDDETREKARQYLFNVVNDINDSNTLTHIKDYNQWTKQIIDLIPLIYKISLIPNGIDNLIEMDNYLKENLRFIYKEAPLPLLLNNYKKEINLNLDNHIENSVKDNIINLFFSDNNSLTNNDKALLLITYYYNGEKEKTYEDITDNYDKIISILQSDDNKFEKEKRIRSISKILK